MTTGLRTGDALSYVSGRWPADVLPLLTEYARIPSLSPAYDPDWQAHGRLDDAAEMYAAWARSRPLDGAVVDVVRLDGLTPTVVVDVPASDGEATGTVLIYGHYDKQPPFDGWSEGRGPWTPVREGDWLYARGVADDGYALPSALVALEAIRAGGGHHARVVIIAEGSEESGSPHLPAVLAHLDARIGPPDIVIALDSGCVTYDRLWVTTSLRGALVGILTVRVLDHGVHSGSAGGVVPSSFRILRLLLDRIEDAATGDLLLPELQVEPPPSALVAAEALARARHEAEIADLEARLTVAEAAADAAERAVQRHPALVLLHPDEARRLLPEPAGPTGAGERRSATTVVRRTPPPSPAAGNGPGSRGADGAASHPGPAPEDAGLATRFIRSHWWWRVGIALVVVALLLLKLG